MIADDLGNIRTDWLHDLTTVGTRAMPSVLTLANWSNGGVRGAAFL
jgi:hypothetical protein